MTMKSTLLHSPSSAVRRLLALALALGLSGASLGCESTDLIIEPLPDVNPNIPAVPTIPPPPYPTTYPDNSYSIWGVRNRMRNTIDTDVEITAYVVEIYVDPECEGTECEDPLAPRFWIADERGATEDRMVVTGYAMNQTEVNEAIADARRGRYNPNPDEGEAVIPTDLAVGNKIKVRGRFGRMYGADNVPNGLLVYANHETLEAVEE